MNYRNISDSAAWPHTVIDHHTYLRLDETISPWACIEGFQIENVSFDILHNLFLGTARDLVASAISVLIRQHVYDHVEGNAESILGYIQREMARDCKSFGLYMPKKPALSEAALNFGEYPELSGKFKAAHVKLLLFWFARKTQEVADAAQEDRVLQALATCCYAIHRFVDILDHADLIVDRDSGELSLLHTRAYTWLSACYLNRRIMLFKIRPKFHYLWHQAVTLKTWRINVGVFANWDEEALLGKVKFIAVACHGRTVTQRVFERYLLVFALTIHRHSELEALS
ncbi:Uncharacterized protein SCF082_LOCUS24047 [Durusdinium trenchii]|uniref:Uncharacterized protein n=1 Tax=Durusdinium trenchii TaxID=1381693 RepID=A0ABP0LRC6_9DINO